MPKKNWVGFYQSDESPVPKVSVQKLKMTKKQADKWLSKQEASVHWTPHIGQLNLNMKLESDEVEVGEIHEIVWEKEE